MRPGMCQQSHLAAETIRSFGSGGITLLRFRATQGPQHEPHSFAGRIVCKRQSDPGGGQAGDELVAQPARPAFLLALASVRMPDVVGAPPAA
jgi:hypothetical protein